jgi:hypothetical protein
MVFSNKTVEEETEGNKGPAKLVTNLLLSASHWVNCVLPSQPGPSLTQLISPLFQSYFNLFLFVGMFCSCWFKVLPN